MAGQTGIKIRGPHPSLQGWSLLLALLFFGAGRAYPAEAGAVLRTEDLRWLNRITYGVDGATVEQYRQLGRKRFLEEQLRPGSLAAETPGSTRSLAQVLADVETENKRIQGLTDEDARQQARQIQNAAANQAAAEAARHHLLRALTSRYQVQEQMTWFWLNHFSVFQGKANLRWTVGDYEETAIRPHALGRFRDLVLATLTHPAMLVYLDNNQSSGGKLNENYARELMELHTLGVDGGYTQQDVQELARVLTGVGVNYGRDPRLKPGSQALYRREGIFEFNPERHDFGDKVLLGTPIAGRGWGEVEQAVDLLVAHPATAHFVGAKLARYWLGQEPPRELIEALAREFQHTRGDIAAVLQVLFASPAFARSLGHATKDPLQFVASAIRLAYNGKRPCNMKPVVNWLNALGEPLFGHVTPDGYPLTGQAWTSPGQMAKRFEIANALVRGNAGLFEAEDGSPGTVTGFPQLASRLYFELLETTLSPSTREALDRANSQQEWNTFLLASPDFMAR
jgi:uncharacterized protein (DUF1800 family)